MTSKLTREQLHERARENVKALKMASRQTAFGSIRDELLADLQLAEYALAAMDSEPVALHMGEAINVFNALKGEQLSERVNNADTGLMGASNVQVWTSKTGGRLEFISANGGCTLNIFPQPAPVVPDDYQRLRELYHAQEKRLFKIARRIKGPAFDKYSHSPSQAIDVLEVAILGEDDACRAAMLNGGKS